MEMNEKREMMNDGENEDENEWEKRDEYERDE